MCIGLMLNFNSVAKSDYCIDQNFLDLYDETYWCDQSLSWKPKVYKIDKTTWQQMKDIAKKISKELGEENADKFFDRLSIAQEKIYKNYKSQSTIGEKEPFKVVKTNIKKTKDTTKQELIKNLDSIDLKSKSSSLSVWKHWLNIKARDDLTKSVTKIDNDLIDQSNSNGDFIPFRKYLKELFGKQKKYSDTGASRKSEKKIADIFVTKKKQLSKYPHKTILGMAYFEFYYSNNLKTTREDIKKFISKQKAKRGIYESFIGEEICMRDEKLLIINNGCSKKPAENIKNLYNLNDVRKKMRGSIGFTLNNEPSDVIKYYITLSKYLEKADPQKQKLNSLDKKKIKLSQSFNISLSTYDKKIKLKNLGLTSAIESYEDNALEYSDYFSPYNEKRFYKKLDKDFKRLKKSISKIESLSNADEFKLVYQSIDEIISITHKDLMTKSKEELHGGISFFPEYSNLEKSNEYESRLTRYLLALDSICFVNNLIKLTKPKIIKNQYEQIWPLDFKIENEFDKDQLSHLNILNQNIKRKKFIDNNKFQSCVLNLINNGYPINKIITTIESKLNIKINSIKMNYKSIDEMKAWNKSDWADSWKGSVPSSLKDEKGNFVNFSQSNIDDIKAQLALNNFNTLLNNNEINNLNIETQDIQNSIQDIKSTNISNLLNQDFSITLDNYSRILAEDAINNFGDQFDAQTIQEIRDNANFENLTAITNMEYGTNMTSSEYKSYWENAQYMDSTSTWGDVTRGVDLISNLSSFDAAAAAKDLGADLQTVADSIAQAASVGISTDLESAAQGLGYNSFSDAVSAYNAEHGTNYTDEEAKEALGQ